MRIKKFFKQQDDTTDIENKTVSGSDNFNFNAHSEFTGPVTRAMKKLLKQQKAKNLAISILCDISKKHCSMCEWEQECSDNPLLFNPNLARQYIAERKSWLINKQSMCAKCKLQLGEHLIDNHTANSSNSIQQCHDFKQSEKVPISDYNADYKALHLGQQIKHDIQQVAQEAKGKCKAMRNLVRESVKTAITKLAPGAFSPKPQTPASAPSSPCTTSASSWNFWPSK